MSTIAPFSRAWKSPYNSSYVYVDSVAGDDLRGLGTQNFPFQSINKAIAYAQANGKNNIVGRGYFSENITNGYNKYLTADALGDLIFDGKFTYGLSNLYLNSTVAGCIITRLINGTNSSQNQIYIYAITSHNYISGNTNLAIRGAANRDQFTSFISLCSNSSLVDLNTASRPNVSGTFLKSIFDNVRVWIDTASSQTISYDTCLFRVNCTFWKRKADGSGDERVDSDEMTAVQKRDAVMGWLQNGTVASGYKKIGLSACEFTDNRIFNCPDNETSGTNYDFSLIYGTRENQPACYMNNGRHIGPFPPAIKIEFKNTSELTTSPYEVEVKDTDNIINDNGTLSLGPGFEGAILTSKPMPIPFRTQFNGFNLSLFPDTNNMGVFLTHRADSVDMDVANRIDISTPVALEENKCYLVKADTASAAVYKGVAYGSNQVLMADDSSTECSKSGTGNVYLYPMKHPSIWNNVQVKICESGVLPDDFIANNDSYPWLPSTMFSELRCLREGNMQNGAMALGTDGIALTNAHPEYYSASNINRPKFIINAAWIALRINIIKCY